MPLIAPILNHASSSSGGFALPADGWYHLVPAGEFPHAESGLVQVIDSGAVQSMLRRFREDAVRPNFPGLLVDQEHWSYDPARSSEAFGWVKELQSRADGIWGRIKWTDFGEQAVSSGRYRLRSPSWLASDVERLSNNRIRPLRLDSIGLTNNPNLKGLAPLSNRGALSGASSSNPTTPTPSTIRMKQILIALGLPEDTAEEAVLAEIARLKQRAGQFEQAAEPLHNRIRSLEAENTGLKNSCRQWLETTVDQDLEKYASRFRPDSREVWRSQLIANRGAALQLLDSLPNPAESPSAALRPLHNRQAARTPGGAFSPAASASAQDDARAKAISNRARQISRRDKKPYSQAWQEAESELTPS